LVDGANARLCQLTLLKECYIDDTAKRFQQAGFAALVYDHCGWGSSEGKPKNETNPIQQVEDYHDAVSFARRMAPAIDPSRIGIWGIGHSGGASMIASGDDPRIRVTILNMPFTSGKRDAKDFPPGGLEEALQEREEKAANPGNPQSYIPVWDDSLEQAKASGKRALSKCGRIVWMHGEAPYKFISDGMKRSKDAGTPWENKITLQSLYYISRVEPEDHIHKIAPRSFLYLAASSDVLTGPPENHKRVFARATQMGFL
jgi:predicted acyl esterase